MGRPLRCSALAVSGNCKDLKPAGKRHARAAATKTNTRRISSKGFGSLRKICHATKLIDDLSARGKPANESVGQSRKPGHRKAGNPERRDSMRSSLVRARGF